MRSKLRSQGVKKGQIFPKSGYFLRNLQLSQALCKLARFRNSQMVALDLSYQSAPSDWRSDQRCVHQRSIKVKITCFGGKRFLSLTSELHKIGEWFGHHCVPLVKPDRLICFLTSKGQLVNLTPGQLRSRSQSDLSRSCCISEDASWWDKHFGTFPMSVSLFYQKLLAKMYGDLMTS